MIGLILNWLLRRSLAEPPPAIAITMDGWEEGAPSDRLRIWRDPDGAVLSLATADYLEIPDPANLLRVRDWCRDLAKQATAGLLEADVTTGPLGPTVTMIYKRLKKPAYTFTGMLFAPHHDFPHVWTIVDGERGTTGIREAIITAELMKAGKLTIDQYQRSWAQDPYDPDYREVDGSVLRFVSDDVGYDVRFPDHPLSKVRRVLAALPESVRVESGAR